MSATIVKERCLNNIINFLVHIQAHGGDTNTQCTDLLEKLGYTLAKDSDCGRLLQDMLNLNIQAVKIRFPFTKVIYTGDYNFKHGFNTTYYKDGGIYQALKSIHYWLYQCMEGEPTESSELYVTFCKIVNILNGSIVEQMPQYKEAIWS